jgi:hypothetical protein
VPRPRASPLCPCQQLRLGVSGSSARIVHRGRVGNTPARTPLRSPPRAGRTPAATGPHRPVPWPQRPPYDLVSHKLMILGWPPRRLLTVTGQPGQNRNKTGTEPNRPAQTIT